MFRGEILEYPFLLTGSRWWAGLKRCRFKHDGGVGGWLGGLRHRHFVNKDAVV